MKAFHEAMKDHQHTEELRLGYVTFTRPRSLLLGSGHWWGPSQKKPRGPSDFLRALYDHCAAGYGEIEAWADEPAEDEENPALHTATADQVWPLPLDAAALARRRAAADTVLAHLDALAARPASRRPALHDPPATNTRTGPRHRTTTRTATTRTATTPTVATLTARSPTTRRRTTTGRTPASRTTTSLRRTFRTTPSPPATCPRPAPSSPPRTPPPTGTPGTPGAPDGPPSPTRPPAPQRTTPRPAEPQPAHLTPEEARTIASWDRDLDALTGELLRARQTVTDVPLPATLTASQLLRLAEDPDGLAQELARPMPRPRNPAARRAPGSTHGWKPA